LRIRSALVFAAALVGIIQPAVAKTYNVPIWNPYKLKVTGATAQHAKVVDFKATSAETFNLTIDLPDGKPCSLILRIRLSPGMQRIEGRSNVCAGEGLTIVRR
jgi:hypothetical protein